MTRARPRVAVLGAVLLALTAGAGPGEAARAPVLGRATTFSARRTSVVAVTLPRAVAMTVDGVASGQVTLSGRGRLLGLVLVRGGTPQPVVVTALQVTPCDGPGCAGGKPFGAQEMVAVEGARRISAEGARPVAYELPAGRYQAHVLTDGAPVSVTLRFRELSGRPAVTATAPLAMVVTEATPTAPGTPFAYSAGAAAPARGPLTLLAHLLLHDATAHVEHVRGTCLYHDTTPPGGHVAPGCPGGQAGLLWHTQHPTTRYQAATYGFAYAHVRGDSWYQGAYVDGVQGPAEVTATFFWADLRT